MWYLIHNYDLDTLAKVFANSEREAIKKYLSSSDASWEVSETDIDDFSEFAAIEPLSEATNLPPDKEIEVIN